MTATATTDSTRTPGGADLPRPPRRPRHRWLAAIIVVLLIAIPAGYLVLSAYQSRDSGEEKERAASARTMIYGWPSKVQRRIYDVPLPDGVTYVGHFETNAWNRSTLYVQFRSSPEQLSFFLEELGTTRDALNEGTVTITGDQADLVGWVLDDPTHRYAGTIVQQSPDEPEVAVTVDLSAEERPRIYVASTSEQ
ncbi:hypothetical protein [Streptomyces sp. B6B3]|uniref:hypothetical protein n=1 Tax=Streptomyces sp. B6B3 TaxID=3153570 RepID=UPI00325D2865